jgi:hypothetical protein
VFCHSQKLSGALPASAGFALTVPLSGHNDPLGKHPHFDQSQPSTRDQTRPSVRW